MSISNSWRALAAIVACGALVAACGQSSSSSTTPPSTSASAGAGITGPTISELAARQQTIPTLPTVKPAPAGTSVWIVDSSLEAPGSAYVGNTVKSIMEQHLHWNVTLFDGQSQPSRFATGIQQALVAHAAGIVLVAIDCSTVKPALESAKSAGVPVVNLVGYDCSDASQGGGASLLTSADFGGSPAVQYEALGTALADYVAAESNGNAKAVVATEPDLHAVVTELEAFKKELTKVCSTCQITAEAPALIADLSSGAAAQKLSQTLLQNPGANMVVALQDSQLAYVTNALRTSGKHLPVLASGPLPTDPQSIRNGTLQGVMAYDASMSMWIMTDTMVRLLAHTDPVVVPAVTTLMDAQHNLPATGGFTAPIDYESLYQTSWGV